MWGLAVPIGIISVTITIDIRIFKNTDSNSTYQ